MARYQGYPYVNPMVNDVPTIDSATASQWAHLPRKPLQPSVPGPSGSGAGSSRDIGPSSSGSRTPRPPRKQDEDTPVVYIDVPEPDESEISTSLETPNTDPEFVQDTILYNPFDNKRIDVTRDDESSSGDSYSGRTSPTRAQQNQSPNNRPQYGTQSSTRPRPPQSLPTFMEKESYIYGGHGSDGFPMSPIPVSDFPEPPPAYTETAAPTPTPTVQTPTAAPEPPRTQVIVPSSPDPQSPVGVMSYNRKNLTCQHCSRNVYTLVIRETGWATYVIGIILFCILLPFFVIVYCCDCFKHKNHYCPNCNKLIGYVLPLVGNNIRFVDE